MSDLNLDEYDVGAPSVEPVYAPHEEQAEQTQIEQDIGVPDIGADTATAAPVRRSVPKLDAARLLNKRRGYPYLLSKLKHIKYKGRGHERQYLERYMMTYQLWANRLWPKAKLTDFMELARSNSKDPQIRKYCRDLIEEEKEERVFGKRARAQDAQTQDARTQDARTQDAQNAQEPRQSTQATQDTRQDAQEPQTRDTQETRTAQHIQQDAQDTLHDIQNTQQDTRHTQDAHDTQQTSHDTGIPDDLSQFDGANDDELEAARELYGDLDF